MEQLAGPIGWQRKVETKPRWTLVAAQAVKAIEQHHHEAFFIGVGFHKPHDPVAPKGYFELYPLEEVDLARDPEEAHCWNTPFRIPIISPPSRTNRREFYNCTALDAQIGIRCYGIDLWDDTMVVPWAIMVTTWESTDGGTK